MWCPTTPWRRGVGRQKGRFPCFSLASAWTQRFFGAGRRLVCVFFGVRRRSQKPVLSILDWMVVRAWLGGLGVMRLVGAGFQQGPGLEVTNWEVTTSRALVFGVSSNVQFMVCNCG